LGPTGVASKLPGLANLERTSLRIAIRTEFRELVGISTKEEGRPKLAVMNVLEPDKRVFKKVNVTGALLYCSFCCWVRNSIVLVNMKSN
jgi:hypothetical protein